MATKVSDTKAAATLVAATIDADLAKIASAPPPPAFDAAAVVDEAAKLIKTHLKKGRSA